LLLVGCDLDVANLEHIAPGGKPRSSKEYEGAEAEDHDTGGDEWTH
jgi:hypothetical protein